MRRHVYTDLIAGRDAAMLTPVDWHEFGKRMMAKPSLRGQSVAGFLLTVRRAYGWACRVDVGLLSTNPLLHVTLPRPEDRRAPQVVERATAAAMLDALDRDDLRVQWAIMFYAGLRIAEVCALDWPQVDFNRNVIVVLKSKSRAGVREVPMAAPLRTVLLRWQMQNHGAALGPITRGRRHLRIMSGDPARVAATRCWAGRFPVLHPHDARHTFASWLVAAGEDLANVSKWLGHANIAVTAHYVQTLPKPEGQPLTTSRFDAFLAEA
jgi:integrase